MLAPAVMRVQVHPPPINKYTAFDINSKKTVVSVPKKTKKNRLWADEKLSSTATPIGRITEFDVQSQWLLLVQCVISR